MKINGNLFSTIIGALAISLVVASCNDDFSEEDLLRLQTDLANEQDSLKQAQATEAFNQAGELLSYSVKIVTNDESPVEGASVILLAASDGGTGDSQSLTTDANGQVFFDRVVIGGNILTVSSDGHYDISASVDFGTITEGDHYQIIEGIIIPTPVTESSILPLFSDESGAELATISGVVSIETDLTNTTSEVPQDLTLQANLSFFASQFGTGGSIFPQIYSFDSDLTIGRADVDNTTGAYSMSVPTTADGITVSLIIPNVSANQRIAINGRNGIALDRPEYADVPTNFGPNWGTDFSVPSVPGVIWNFDAPATAGGEGFDFSYARNGRAITTATVSTAGFQVAAELFGLGQPDIIIQVTNRGSGYVNSPQMVITDASGSEAGAEAHIEFAITGLTIAEAGTLFPASTPVQFDLIYDVPFNTFVDGVLDVDTTLNTTDLVGALIITTDAAGAFTQDAVDAALATAISNGDARFDPDNLYQTTEWISNLRLVASGIGDDAVITVSSSIGQIYRIDIATGGGGYTDPSFSFSGGGASTQANIDILEFGTTWLVTLDNSGVTTPYTILPSNIQFEYLDVSTGERDVLLANNLSDSDGADQGTILSLLEVSGGNIQFTDQLTTFATSDFSAQEPNTIIAEPRSTIAAVDVNGITLDDNGGITSYTLGSITVGEGYTSQFGVTVEPAAVGAPGTGAIVELTGGTLLANGEFQWDTETTNLKDGGAGYLETLNQQDFQNYTGTFNATVMSGQTYLFNVIYGTGVKQEAVN